MNARRYVVRLRSRTQAVQGRQIAGGITDAHLLHRLVDDSQEPADTESVGTSRVLGPDPEALHEGPRIAVFKLNHVCAQGRYRLLSALTSLISFLLTLVGTRLAPQL